jgi:hypothetical protein
MGMHTADIQSIPHRFNRFCRTIKGIMTEPLSLLSRQRNILWQSPDQHMEAGFIRRDECPAYYASLGPRAVTLQDIQAFIQILEQLEHDWPLLLLSNCPGFASLDTGEANGLVFYAGHYRALQQQHKQQGRLLLSYLYEVAVGGTYLMHGLSAQHRAAAPDTRFHDTVPAYPTVPLPQVLERGLIDAIIPLAEFPQWLSACLSKASP